MSNFELHYFLINLATMLIIVVFALGFIAVASLLAIGMIQERRRNRGKEVSELRVQDRESEDGSGEKETDE